MFVKIKMAKSYIIKVDEEKCIGCGACVSVCPKTFELKEGIAIVKRSPVSEISCAKEAQQDAI